MANQVFWSGRRVAVTGHTGFKGTWLATWLAELGAEVTGIGLPPSTEPSLFAASDLPRRMHSRIADVRSRELLTRHLREAQPEVIFHLAA
jgi:CDP-glucose 4,6-dehydratase